MRVRRVHLVAGCVLLLASACAELDDGTEDQSVDQEELETPAAGIDLIESAVSNPPAAALDGASFSITDTVKNTGMVAAGASVTRCFLSLDGVHVAGSALLGSRNVAALAPNATDTGACMGTIPAGTPQGTYFVLSCADKTQLVTESNENNNCAASAGTVVVTAPDLTESAVMTATAHVDVTGTMVVSDTVLNGTMAAAPSSTTRFYYSVDNVKGAGDAFVRACVSGQPTPGRVVPALAGAGTSTGTTTVPMCVVDAAGLHPIAVGTYFVIACADELHTVFEDDETNNCAASATTFQVTKCGNGVVEPGEACDDGNNVSGDGCSATCALEGMPDLVETAVSNPPATGAIGSTFMVTDTVKNNGPGLAGVSTTRYFLSLDKVKNAFDPATTASRAVPALGVNATSSGSATITIPTSLAAGSYFVLACADADAMVPETNETNNCLASTTKISVIGADLVETAVSNPPATVVVGGSFAVTDTAQNIGAVMAGATTTKYYLSLNGTSVSGSALLGSRPVPALAAGASNSGGTTAIIPVGTPQGTYFLLVCADRGAGAAPGNDVIETNENNNCKASATKLVLSAPDYTENNVTLAPTTVHVGTTIAVTDTVINGTAAAATASSFTRWYLSNDGVKSTDDPYIRACTSNGAVPQRTVPALAGGASSTGTTTIPLCFVNATGPHPITPGTYFIIACADETHTVAEASETNNCKGSTTSFTVIP